MQEIKMKKSAFGTYIARQGELVDEALEAKVTKYLPRGNDIRYLDVGCHDGTKTIKRAKFIGTKHIYGLDLKTTGSKKAKARGIALVYANLNDKWPLESNSIDIITATEVIEHLVNVDQFVSEIKRVLKPGGRVIISTDNLAAYHNIFALIIGNQPYTGPFISRVYPIGHRPNAKYYVDSIANEMEPHVNVMTSRALEQLLRHYGFRIVKMLGAGFYPFPPPISHILSRIDKRHASHCIAVGEK